jgi:uncharacterized protein (DUF1330 family)
MQVENRIYPDSEQIKVLRHSSAGSPIDMVNLLKFRDKAQYPDGRDAQLSGRAAYERYAIAVTKLVEATGGKVLFSGDVSFLTIGKVEQLWDEVALAQYPSRAAFLQMAMSPAYQEIAVHREAGLAGQLNIETVPTLAGRLG